MCRVWCQASWCGVCVCGSVTCPHAACGVRRGCGAGFNQDTLKEDGGVDAVLAVARALGPSDHRVAREAIYAIGELLHVSKAQRGAPRVMAASVWWPHTCP